MINRPQTLGPCRISRELKPGSLGKRYCAEFDGQPAIVETVSMRCDDELFERALRRIEVMTMVDHPHLVPILYAGIERDQLYVVTPQPSATADGAAPMSGDALRVVADVALGLDHLHQNSTVHRDIQPRHIGWYDGVVMLGGFALSDVDGPSRTHGVGPIGSVMTMAPSIVRGGQATVGSDLYSLGAVLHLLACGVAVHPCRSESLADRVVRIATEAPSLSPTLPPGLASVVRSLLDADGDTAPVRGPAVIAAPVAATTMTTVRNEL